MFGLTNNRLVLSIGASSETIADTIKRAASTFDSVADMIDTSAKQGAKYLESQGCKIDAEYESRKANKEAMIEQCTKDLRSEIRDSYDSRIAFLLNKINLLQQEKQKYIQESNELAVKIMDMRIHNYTLEMKGLSEASNRLN